MKQNNYFYCYSTRLHWFLKAFGIQYISQAKNPNTSMNYWMYEKSAYLDSLIQKWNELKHFGRE